MVYERASDKMELNHFRRVDPCFLIISELLIREGTEDISKIIFLISQ